MECLTLGGLLNGGFLNQEIRRLAGMPYQRGSGRRGGEAAINVVKKMKMTQQPILATWSFIAQASQPAAIVPDGCRDIIIRMRDHEPVIMFATELDDTTRTVHVQTGDSFFGFRLQPGVGIRPELSCAMSSLATCPADAETIREFLIQPRDLAELLAAVQNARGTLEAAKSLGVSSRTLQRKLFDATGRSPSWWRRLARLRKSAKLIASAEIDQIELADLAFQHGYCDQPHMTREFQHWLGVSPHNLRKNGAVADALASTGYGDG